MWRLLPIYMFCVQASAFGAFFYLQGERFWLLIVGLVAFISGAYTVNLFTKKEIILKQVLYALAGGIIFFISWVGSAAIMLFAFHFKIDWLYSVFAMALIVIMIALYVRAESEPKPDGDEK